MIEAVLSIDTIREYKVIDETYWVGNLHHNNLNGMDIPEVFDIRYQISIVSANIVSGNLNYQKSQVKNTLLRYD